MKVKNLIIALGIAILGFQSQPLSGYSQVQNSHKEISLNQQLKKYLLKNHVNGSVIVVKKDKVIFNEPMGLANRNKATANQPLTTFPIGSITKASVAVSIMQLQERGQLSVYDSLSKYIPDFPSSRKIKLIHLLNHTSGIQPPLLIGGYPKPREIVVEAAKRPSNFSAGEKWDYNDINYLILGFIIEKITRETLHEYIQKNIFDKASMNHSGFMTKNNPAPYSSTGYLMVANHFLPVKKLNTAMLFSCGDIYSTAYDIFLFDKALMSGKLVTNDSLKQMLTPSTKSKYGMGLYITKDRIYSRGVLSGWEGLHVYYKDQTEIVILLNVRDKRINIHQLSMDIYKIVQS